MAPPRSRVPASDSCFAAISSKRMEENFASKANWAREVGSRLRFQRRRYWVLLAMGEWECGGNREQGTGNREQGTGNRKQGTGNSEQGGVRSEQCEVPSIRRIFVFT